MSESIIVRPQLEKLETILKSRLCQITSKKLVVIKTRRRYVWGSIGIVAGCVDRLIGLTVLDLYISNWKSIDLLCKCRVREWISSADLRFLIRSLEIVKPAGRTLASSSKGGGAHLIRVAITHFYLWSFMKRYCYLGFSMIYGLVIPGISTYIKSLCLYKWHEWYF